MKAEINEIKAESSIQDYPSFKGKLELIFKIMNVLISLSLSEGQFSDENIKSDCLKKYDDLFRKLDNEMFLSTQNSFQKELFNTILKDINSFNPKLIKEVLSALKTFKLFMTGEINIDALLEKLINSLQFSITQITGKIGKNHSFILINGFNQYLDEFSDKIKSLKQVLSKKKFQDEEIKIKEKEEDIYKKLSSEIEKLKKQLEGKGKELEMECQKSIKLSLDNSSYIASNEILNKKLVDSKITIKEKDKLIQEYRNKIDNMEKLLSSIDKKYTLLEKDKSEYAAEIQKLKNTTSNEIQKLKNINSKKAVEIQNLKTNLSKNNTEIQTLNNKIKKLEDDNFQMNDKNQLLEQRIENLEKDIVRLSRLNEELKQNNKTEIDLIKNEQMKNIRICMNNFRELINYAQYLEENNLDLYEKYTDLADQINLFMAEYELDNTDDNDENFFNFNLNFK